MDLIPTIEDGGSETRPFNPSGPSPASAEKASAPEIEITPEMITAGIEAESLWDSGDLPEWKVIDIYRQMERTRRSMAGEKMIVERAAVQASD